ncbi:hypothetical protein SLE2022_016150 [Rubroshorea leprosula]
MEGWLRSGIVREVGDGSETLFWKDIWCWDESLKENFLRLFNISRDKEIVARVGQWKDGTWSWAWRWRRNLFAWEINLLQDLTSMVESQKPRLGKTDRWSCRYDSKSCYSVCSAYKTLSMIQHTRNPRRYKLLWRKNVPMKVAVFAWTVNQERLPTADGMAKRGLKKEGENMRCVLCGSQLETTDHLFVYMCKSMGGMGCLL